MDGGGKRQGRGVTGHRVTLLLITNHDYEPMGYYSYGLPPFVVIVIALYILLTGACTLGSLSDHG